MASHFFFKDEEQKGSVPANSTPTSSCNTENPTKNIESVYFDDRQNTLWQNKVYVQALSFAKEHRLFNILDFGCGSAYKLVLYSCPPDFEFVGQDIEPTLSWLKEKYPMYTWQQSFSMPPLEIHLILCVDVLQYFYEPERVLKFFQDKYPNTYLVLSAPLKKDRIRPPNAMEWNYFEFKSMVTAYFCLLKHEIYLDHLPGEWVIWA